MNQKIPTLAGTAIIIILAFAVGYFVWLTQKNNPIETQIPVVSINQTKKSDVFVQSADETANWQTYADGKYGGLGIEFKYPSNWQVELNSDGQLNKVAPERPIDCEKFSNGGINCYDYFYFGTEPINKGNPDMENFLEAKHGNGAGVESIENVIVGGRNAYRVHLNDMDESSYPPELWVPLTDGILFFFIGTSLNAEELGIYNKIITTFKFIDKVSDEKFDWQTYRNDTYGIEFKYPPKWTALRYGFSPGADYQDKVTIINNDSMTFAELDAPNRKIGLNELIYTIDFWKHSSEEKYQTNVKKIKINSNDNFDIYFIDDFRNPGKNEFDQILSTFKFTN